MSGKIRGFASSVESLNFLKTLRRKRVWSTRQFMFSIFRTESISLMCGRKVLNQPQSFQTGFINLSNAPILLFFTVVQAVAVGCAPVVESG
jgi:hypothetical protein